MKPVFINFSDENGETVKTYTTCSMKTGMVDQIFEMADRADSLERDKISVKDAKNFYMDLKALILAIFKYQFSLEDLNEGVEQDELLNVFKEICSRIGAGSQKN